MSDIGSDHARLRCDSASQIGYLEEIVINILARLPVKNVVICKCVAKHWLRLTSEPQFLDLQLSLSKKSPKYIICPFPKDTHIITHLSLMEENGNISRNIPLPEFADIWSPEMVCFMNGLICSVDEYYDVDFLIDVNINIFNPNTEDFLHLPRGSPSHHITPSVAVAFDPKTHDFKAFRFFLDSLRECGAKFKCEVYSSSFAQWRMISEDIKPPEYNPFNTYIPMYVSVAGKVYWFVWSKEEPKTILQILSVDMNDNFTEIELPTIMHRWSFLIEFEGCLSVVHLNYPDPYELHLHEDPRPYVEVYKLKDERWCLIAKAELSSTEIFSVAARDNEIFFITRLNDMSFCYLIFDLNDRTWLTLDLVDTFEGCFPVAFPFVESLFNFGYSSWLQ